MRNKKNAPNPTKRLTMMQCIEFMQITIFSNCGIEEECRTIFLPRTKHLKTVWSMWTNQYDLIPNLGTNFTGSNKLGKKFQYSYFLLFLLLNKVCPQFYHIRQEGWSELATTSAEVQDEAIQAVLGMNQKHILPCPRFLVFAASSLPQIFFLPTYFPPTYLPTPTYLTSFYVRESLGELEVKGQKWQLELGRQKWQRESGK